MRLRHRRLQELQKQVTPEMIQALDQALAQRASKQQAVEDLDLHRHHRFVFRVSCTLHSSV